MDRNKPAINEAHTEVLDAHSKLLLTGLPEAVTAYEESRGQTTALRSMMQTAQRAAEHLAPVEPSRRFLTDLKNTLMAEYEQSIKPARRRVRIPRLPRLSRGVETALSILTIAGIATRLVGTVIMIAIFLAKRRRSSTAAA